MSLVRERKNAAQRARNARHKAAGLCRCGRQPDVNRKSCNACLKSDAAAARRRYARQTERIKTYQHEYCRRPEVRERTKELRSIARSNPERATQLRVKNREAAYRKTFGISGAEVLEMHIAQAGRCAICQRAFTETGGRGAPGLGHVDHCHATGRVRALLCLRCNTSVGKIEKLNEQGLLGPMCQYILRFRDGS